jgi:hypothetical protein
VHEQARQLISTQDQHEYAPQGQTARPIMGAPRRVRVKGRQGVDATVVVTVVRDTVWLSITPPFTWEAIMAPGKVEEIISMLTLARDEAKKVTTARKRNASGGGKAVVPVIASDSPATQ